MQKFLKFIDSRPGVALLSALCVLVATYAKDFVDNRLTQRVDPVVKELSAIREEIIRMREEQKSLFKLLEIQENRITRLEEKK
ncbi:MAG: hypothetical protein AB1405_06510 [Bdellovibrionota bacterium]